MRFALLAVSLLALFSGCATTAAARGGLPRSGNGPTRPADQGPAVRTARLARGLSAKADVPLSTAVDRFERGDTRSLLLPVTWLSRLWTRKHGTGSLSFPSTSGGTSDAAEAHVTHRGTLDWALPARLSIPVHAREVYQLSSSALVQGTGSCAIEVVAFDRRGRVVNWSLGAVSSTSRGRWNPLASRFIIPAGVVRVEPRWSGRGPLSAELGAMKLTRLPAISDAGVPVAVSVQSATLRVTVETATAALSVTDLRDGRTWRQLPLPGSFLVTSARVEGGAIALNLVDAGIDMPFRVRIAPAAGRADVTVTLTGRGALPQTLAYPFPFRSGPRSHLIIPMNEGITFRADDQTIRPMTLAAFSGNDLSMSFWGVTDTLASDSGGAMAIIDTPNDAAIDIQRMHGLLTAGAKWLSQKGQWGYARRVTYAFFTRGGFVAMCMRYRQHAVRLGLYRTLAEKRKEDPAVDRLVGAADVWYFGPAALSVAHELDSAGIRRVLWSERETPAVIAAMNRMRFLTGRYDIYQDVMNPADFPRLRGVNPDWPTRAWPADIVRNTDGSWLHGWKVRARDGKWYAAGVMNDERALSYARARIPADLATHPYRARFIDTATASPWRQDYSPAHPLTRSDSRSWRMKLLSYVSGTEHLVTGSETGIDAAVPYVDYFEGMMSLTRYRVRDAGRNVRRIIPQVPKQIVLHQLNYRYRLPLFDLVYHGCVISYWYWGDYSNKIPAVWHLRDLFDVLYAQPPVYMFSRRFFAQYRSRFIGSYRTVEPTARAAGYASMDDFRFLSADRSVEQSTFSNGVRVTVNFGTRSYTLPDGTVVPPGGYHSTAG